MKLQHLLTAAALALPLCVSAKPAYPGILSHQNPDGSRVEFRMYGDENFSYITDLDNHLMERTLQGEMKYVLANGVKVKASTDIVESMRMAEAEKASKFRKSRGMVQQMPARDKETGQTKFNTLDDNMHAIVILVEFSDKKFYETHTREYYQRLFNEEGFNDFPDGAVSFGSARDYYIQCSGGKFKPTFDISPVVTLPKTSAYYTGTGTGGLNTKYLHADEAFTYAVAELDPVIDFSQYDNDGDGRIDLVYFIYAGYSQADTADPTCIWPHQSNLMHINQRPDNVLFAEYACSAELNGADHYTKKDMAVDGIGTFCHEFAHALGLPDLYDPNYKVDTTPGYWSVMDKGPYNGDGYCPPLMSAYERYVLKWLSYEDAVDCTYYELPYAYAKDQRYSHLRVPVALYQNGEFVRNSTNEYFLLESRHRTGWDTFLKDEGMLIWHIDYDENYWATNAVNRTEGHPRVMLVTADGSGNVWLDNKKDAEMAAWPGTGINNTLITPVTEITTNTYHSAAARTNNTFITDIAFDDEKKVSTFDYNFYTESPREFVTLQSEYKLLGENKIHLSWTPVEGATDYQLTVVRENSIGTKFYESGLKEKRIGNVTSYDLPLSTSKMNFTYEWYVRAVKGIPAETISRSRTFVGSKLPENSGVEDIITDETASPVYGIAGAIVAPAEAEIYTISGVRTGANNLTPGVYVVKHAGKATKVVVK